MLGFAEGQTLHGQKGFLVQKKSLVCCPSESHVDGFRSVAMSNKGVGWQTLFSLPPLSFDAHVVDCGYRDDCRNLDSL